MRTGAITEPTFEAIVQADLNTCVHRKPVLAGRPEWFTLAYFHTPDELRRDIQQAGFLDTDVLAVEGPDARADLDTRLDEPSARAVVLRAIARVERDPSLLGASPHLRAVATRP